MNLSVNIDLDELAAELTYALHSHVLRDFILQIDAELSDLQFTIALRDRLNEVIKEETSD